MNDKKRQKTTKQNTLSSSAKIKTATKAELQESVTELEKKIRALTELNRVHKRKIFDLYTIFEISRNFNTLLDYQQLLDTFIFTSLAQVGSMKAAFYLSSHNNENNFILTKFKGSGKFPSKNLSFKAGSKMLLNLTKK